MKPSKGFDALGNPIKEETEIAIQNPPTEIESIQVQPQPQVYTESLLWSKNVTKGTFNKHTVWSIGFSQHYLYITRFDDNGENPQVDMNSLKDVDAVVVDSFRQGSMGMSYGWGMGIRTYMPRTSSTMGNVKFIAYGETLATLGIEDPFGVVRLFNTAKKSVMKAYGPKCKGSLTCMNPTVNGWCKVHAMEKTKSGNTAHIGTELAKLAKLLEKGELTKEEYDRAKARTLK